MIIRKNLILIFMIFLVCNSKITYADTKKPLAIDMSSQDMAAKNILELNIGMFKRYDNALLDFQNQFLSKHPLILGLFSGGGGKMMLYRPGKSVEEAPPVPFVYQILKSTGHSTMAISGEVLQAIDKNDGGRWRESISNYLFDMKKAVAGLDAVPMNEEWRLTIRNILNANVDYMTMILDKNQLTLIDLDNFGQKTKPDLKKIISWAAQTQVNHWMKVLDQWKNDLGADWNKTYAASNTIYVARQNNILFSVLAQYFSPRDINDRLLLIETISFTTTPQDMLTSISRIISDRNVGQIFFGNNRVMDYELMGGDARNAIVAEMKKRGKDPYLPPLVQFGSNQWPALVTPGAGPKTLNDLQ
jgi:hypothetical protein